MGALIVIVVAMRLLALAAVAMLVAGCSADEEPSTSPSTTSTRATAATLEDLDPASLAVRRAPFCSALDPAAVEAALGSPVSGTADYSSGDQARITEGIEDVAHEYACTVAAEGGTVARAWVFAPPVSEAWAKGLASASLRGCRAEAAPSFGRPAAAWRCDRDGRPAIRLAGLFGDAWLSCEVQAREAAALADAVDRWCATAVSAAAS